MAFTEQFKATCAICATVAVSSFTVGAWLNNTVGGLQRDIAELKTDRYTIPMAAEAALRAAIENPGLRVPDPRDPNKVIVVAGKTMSFDR